MSGLHVEKVEGFSSDSFTENHATSFGLLVYVSRGSKRRYPDAMLAGLLDSQPVGGLCNGAAHTRCHVLTLVR